MREKQLETLRKVYYRESNYHYESMQDNFYINSFMMIYLENPVNVKIENKNYDVNRFFKDFDNQDFLNLEVTSKYLENGIKSIAGRKYSLSVRYQPWNRHTINARLLKAVMDLLAADKVEVSSSYCKPWKISGEYGVGYLMPVNVPDRDVMFFEA